MIMGKEDRRVELEEVSGCMHRDVLTVEGRVFRLLLGLFWWTLTHLRRGKGRTLIGIGIYRHRWRGW